MRILRETVTMLLRLGRWGMSTGQAEQVSLAVADDGHPFVPAGLTPARLSALSVIVFAGPRSLGALAAAEGVAGPTMTRIVDGLVDGGLAERRPDPSDGRAVVIAPTATGETLMRAAAGRRIAAIARAIADLPAADRRRLAAAAGLLDRLAAHIRAVGPEAG